MIYEICVRSEFSAAHRLRSSGGDGESLHGHNWAVEARIGSDELTSDGMVMDFGLAQGFLKKVLDELDHKNLNELIHFADKNPTAECVGRFIYEELEKRVAPREAHVSTVTVWETPDCAVTCRKVKD